jgi:hypothetical protein
MRRTRDNRQTTNRERGVLFWVTPKAARLAVVALHVVAGIAVLVELLFPFPEDGHAVERVHALDFPASYAVYGFTACVILVLLGIVLRHLVMRDEDYYQDGGR